MLYATFFTSILLGGSSYLLNAASVIPGGENVAIEIRTNGLLVTGTYDIKTSSGTYNPAVNSDIVRGDLIFKVNEHDVESIKDLAIALQDNEADEVNVNIYRNSKEIQRTLKLIKSSNTNSWKTGLLVKERILGIGTISFYDPSNNTYGALGHELSDGELTRDLDLTSGNIYYSDVIGIKKSTDGTPGEKIAEIDENIKLGTVTENNDYGVYGQIDKIPNKEPMETASIDEIKLGDAEIWTVLSGNDVEKFAIKITKLEKQKSMKTKGITFEITDKKLLKLTNGIVQGMSGSPIIQENKIIGAVTHVLVDDVKMGYGLYIEWMLEENND